jgi:hypothetical protein
MDAVLDLLFGLITSRGVKPGKRMLKPIYTVCIMIWLCAVVWLSVKFG